MSKARVTKVPLGDITLDGLAWKDDNGQIQYGISISQWAELPQIQTSKNTASRDIKRLLGKDFKTSKVKVEGGRNDHRVLSLEQFNQATMAWALAGHAGAKEFALSLSGLALHQMFADAFGDKFDKEDRANWLTERIQHRQEFRPLLTDWLKLDDPDRDDYGKEVNRFKLVSGLPLKSVDEYTYEQLSKLNTNYKVYATLRKIGMTHKQALRQLS